MRSLRTGLSLAALVTGVAMLFTAPAAHAADTPRRDLAAAQAKLSSLLQDHISTEVGRYKGKITAWDVVNEPFNEDGTYRSDIWYDHLGADYIANALTWAHAADPNAKLYINDYNVEGVNAKST